MSGINAVDFTDERTMLSSSLDFQRQLVRHRVARLGDERSKVRLVASLTTPAGVVSHLAGVERFWFVKIFQGRPWDPPWSKEDPDAAWRVDDRDLAEILADYEQATSAASLIVARHDLDARAAAGSQVAPEVTLRWILVHMIAETAQHNGQLDILLEQLEADAGAAPPVRRVPSAIRHS